MRKFKFYIDFEKEEYWLNEMAKQGWELTGISFGYKFVEREKDDINIRIDHRNFKRNSEYQDYIALFSDSGWEHIAGTKTSGKQYFKRTDQKADEDIFSDIHSKCERYQSLSKMWFSIAMYYIPVFAVLLTTKAIEIDVLFNPKLLYYTPGLWEKTGYYFWKAFLFETPFAIMRGLGWFIFPILIVLYMLFAIRAKRYYRK